MKRKTYSLAKCCILALMALLTALASHGEKMPTQYTRRIWHIQDGLPEETVQAIRQTADGFLWIGTTGGLVRFDGSHFMRPVPQSRGVPGSESSTFSILAAHDGSLWLGTEGEGLLHYKDGAFYDYGPKDGLTDGFVRSIIEDSRHNIWIGTDNGLFRWTNGKIEAVNTSLYSPLAVHSILEDREHRIWIGGSQLLVLGPAGLKRYRLPGAFSQNRVKCVYQTSDGTIWVGTVEGLNRLVGDEFRPVSGITGTVRTLAQTRDGTLWIGTIGHGLFTYKNSTFARFGSIGLLPSKTVLSVFEDDTQQVWIGTQDGLVRLSRTPVSVIPLPGGSDPDNETLSCDPAGTIWAVAQAVYAIREGVARQHKFAGISKLPIRNVFRDHSGTLWIGTDGTGAYRLDPSGPVRYSAPERLSNNFVRGFMQARDGTIWVATDEGVSRINKDHVQNLRMRDGLTYFSTRALIEDRDNGIWIGTDQGLSHWRDGAFLHDTATEGLRNEKIWSILQDRVGDIWFGTRNHGLFRYRSGMLTHYTVEQGLASNSIYQILEDRRGNLWLSGPNSISSLEPPTNNAGSPQGGSFLALTVYDLPYGADGAQMYGGRQPSGCISRDGGVWFPSNKGAVYVTPDLPQSYTAPRLLITSAASDGRKLDLGSRLSLPANSGRLEFAFAPLMLRSQESIRFRYHLEGFDSGWTYAGANREATYTNLPAGRYTFRVVAFEVNHPENTSEISLSLIKRQYFYYTWWFLSLCLFMVSLLILVIYRSRIRSVRLRFKAVLEERSRVAREMHDTVIQGCTSVSALLEAVSSLQTEKNALEESLLDHARAQVRTTIDEAREAVWNLRHDEMMQDLSNSVETIAEHTRREFNVAVEAARTGRPFPIPGTIARELLMVLREAVYNAALHGRPQCISITVAYSRSEILLTVADNGRGFDPSAPAADGKAHYGIAGMRERVERIHGRIQLASCEGQGTTVQIRLGRSHILTPSLKSVIHL